MNEDSDPMWDAETEAFHSDEEKPPTPTTPPTIEETTTYPPPPVIVVTPDESGPLQTKQRPGSRTTLTTMVEEEEEVPEETKEEEPVTPPPKPAPPPHTTPPSLPSTSPPQAPPKVYQQASSSSFTVKEEEVDVMEAVTGRKQHPARKLVKCKSTTDSFYQSVNALRKKIQWTWTVNYQAYEEGSNARVFYHRMIGEFNNTITMLMEMGTEPKDNCAIMVLHIYDRLLFLFDRMCDAEDSQSQEIFINLTRDIVSRLFELARYAAHDDHQHYDLASSRESVYVASVVRPKNPEILSTYIQYMKFLQVVTHEEDIGYLRHAVLSNDSLHRAYILPMASFCNMAKNTGRPFPASNLAMLTVKICRIVEIACGDEITPISGSTDRVLECCWDLFDSIIQGDLAARESKILEEVRIVPKKTPAKQSSRADKVRAQAALPSASSLSASRKPAQTPPPLEASKESSGCALQ